MEEKLSTLEQRLQDQSLSGDDKLSAITAEVSSVLSVQSVKIHETPGDTYCHNTLHAINLLISSDSQIEDMTLLCIPIPAIGRKNFNIAAAYAWNELPRNIRLAPFTAAFKRLLKTHLF